MTYLGFYFGVEGGGVGVKIVLQKLRFCSESASSKIYYFYNIFIEKLKKASLSIHYSVQQSS